MRLQTKKDTLYYTLYGELWSVSNEYFEENWLLS